MIYGAPASLYGSGLYGASAPVVSERKKMSKIALKLKEKNLDEKIALSLTLETNLITAEDAAAALQLSVAISMSGFETEGSISRALCQA